MKSRRIDGAFILTGLLGLTFLGVLLYSCGCAAHKQKITATPVVIIPRECITKVELTPGSECYLSKDGNLTLCRHVNITRKERCEMLKANP